MFKNNIMQQAHYYVSQVFRIWLKKYRSLFCLVGLAIPAILSTSCSIDYARYGKAQRCSGLFSYERQVKPTPEIEQKFYKVTKQFGGPGIYFVDFFKAVGKKHCGRPAIDYVLFLDGYLKNKPKTDFQSMVKSVDTAIHETAHHYSSLARQYEKHARNRKVVYSRLGNTSFYTKAMGPQHLTHTQTFPGKEIARVITHKGVLQNSRYTSYISEASIYHVTQQFGIYGMLDEFHAYYYSVLTNNNILKTLNKKQRKVQLKDGAFTMIGNSDIDLSFLEFKLFILSYFRTAEQYYPAIYQQLITYPQLLDITLNLHDEFDQVYRESQRISKKHKVHDSFKKDRAILKQELALPAYNKMLQKLRKARRKLRHKINTARRDGQR